MADVILRLRVDPVTGRRELVIDYTSDSDALPIEHEDAHRRIADHVVHGGLANPAVAVSRAAEQAAAAAADGEPPASEPVAEPTAK